MSYRQYQEDLKQAIRDAWAAGAQDVAAVLSTGGGKTKIFSDLIAEQVDASVAIAHRAELVSQMSLALARNGVRHRVIGPDTLQRTCVRLHMDDLGKNFVDPSAKVAAVSVDTLVRMPTNDPWFARVKLVVTDEAAHLLKKNKWGKARSMFPNARGLGVTATPIRADGAGLGRHSDGVFDVMVEGPAMRDLIRWGYLTDYRIFAPPNTLDLSEVGIAASGDYSPPALKTAVNKAHITGDIVEHYKRIAPGKLGVTFCVSVEAAIEVTGAYREAGVPAEVITGETPDVLRASILRRFRNREVLQLCSVDIFSEGFDLPAIEVVSMARPTQSFGLYCQQVGRALRPLEGKQSAILIDHVGNVERFARTRGLPDTPQVWSLDRRERANTNKPSDAEPVRVCPSCSGTYKIIEHGNVCPYCATEREPAGRSTPAQVDGVLHELDPDVLRLLRREADDVMGPAPMQGAGHVIAKAAQRTHKEKQTAQNELRALLATWGAWQVEGKGRTHEQAQRQFFTRYGIDPLTAAALHTGPALDLAAKIAADLAAARYNVDGSVIN